MLVFYFYNFIMFVQLILSGCRDVNFSVLSTAWLQTFQHRVLPLHFPQPSITASSRSPPGQSPWLEVAMRGCNNSSIATSDMSHTYQSVQNGCLPPSSRAWAWLAAHAYSSCTSSPVFSCHPTNLPSSPAIPPISRLLPPSPQSPVFSRRPPSSWVRISGDEWNVVRLLPRYIIYNKIS